MSTSSIYYNNNITHYKQYVNTYLPTSLKTYPELNAYCLKNKLHKGLLVYYATRAINTNGSGIVSIKRVLQNLTQNFGLPRPTAYKYLESGRGKFYTIVRSKQFGKFVHLYSYEKIAGNFKISHLSLPVLVEISNCKNLKSFKAWLYATGFKTDTYDKIVHPISHQSLKESTGLSPNTQLRYNKLLPLKTTHNFADYFTAYCGKNHEYWIQKRLSNSYIIKAQIGNRGMLKRINRRLKHNSNQSLSGEASDTKVQKYFNDSQSFLKCPIKNPESYVFDKVYKGFNLWNRS